MFHTLVDTVTVGAADIVILLLLLRKQFFIYKYFSPRFFVNVCMCKCHCSLGWCSIKRKNFLLLSHTTKHIKNLIVRIFKEWKKEKMKNLHNFPAMSCFLLHCHVIFSIKTLSCYKHWINLMRRWRRRSLFCVGMWAIFQYW